MPTQDWWRNGATVSTIAGAVLAIALGVADAGWLHLFDRQADAWIIGGGVGALLGHNPIAGAVSAAKGPPAA